ncbi:hypothetical protein [Azospirillum sp.]|uniref:hypothetical protein n=1 Tax=Azospirillum sp. TaxID=34012 RepID=UPI002D707242|nr:hypothetical protein [Azospirillum sp.]HYD64639.1 hypothetical protein [Azospirillum sp.]
MNDQKYHVGQIVQFCGWEVKRGAPSGDHRVERLLPPDSGEHQYRVKAVESGRERVVRESQIGGRVAVETLAQSLYEAENATNVPWSQRGRPIRDLWLKEARSRLADADGVG